MIRKKALPWLLGVALLAFSLVAALRSADTPVNGSGGKAAPLVNLPVPVGPTVFGTVDTFPHPISPLNAPSVLGMPALTVEKVLVSEGDAVEPGQVLVEFAAGPFVHKLTQAKKQLLTAQWKAVEANAAKTDHAEKLALQKLAIETSEKQLNHAEDVYARYKTELDRVLETATKPLTDKPLTAEEKERRRGTDENLIKYTALVTELKARVQKEKIELKRLEAVPIDAPVQQANAAVEQIQAAITEAEAQIESFKLRAQVAGTVEQIKVVPGTTFGPTTREPLMYLMPAGKRVIRAEVEAEFAHKIESYKGKSVTICEAHHSTHTYPGTVLRVSGAFLPKRFGGDALVANPSRILECTIEVADPTPAGKPPLRPGQQVRVVFGQ
jgi:multidrug resistance efflux pump